jgi:hypothetical protein
MCDKCTEIDGRIAHLRELAARLVDPQTIEGIKRLIEEMLAQKAALHPDQEQ